MSTPSPQTASIELYNELVALAHDQRERIGQIEWTLRALHRKAPGDPRVAVALVAAVAMKGDVRELDRALAYAWGLRHVMATEQKASLVDWLGSSGRCENALEIGFSLSRDWLSQPRGRNTISSMADAAYQLGDLDVLKVLRDDFRHQRAGTILSIIEQMSHLDRFRDYQMGVRSIIADTYTTRRIGVIPSDEGIHIHDWVYVDGTASETKATRDRVFDQIEDLCLSLDLPAGAFCPPIIFFVRNIASLGVLSR